MICHEFKGGIGTASWVVLCGSRRYTVGVLVQANYGRRERLTIAGIPVGRLLLLQWCPLRGETRPSPGSGSIIAVAGIDAPLLPHQCSRLAQRAGLGIARVGGVADHTSGDLFLAFATGSADGQPSISPAVVACTVELLDDQHVSRLYDAVVGATEEAIVNTLLAASTMVGRDGITACALPADKLRRFVAAYQQANAGLAP